MSATLGAAGALTFRTSSTVEVPAKTGQFITLFATSEIALKRPNKLRARVTGEVPNFDLQIRQAHTSQKVQRLGPTPPLRQNWLALN
jgi:hypothetical protein